MPWELQNLMWRTGIAIDEADRAESSPSAKSFKFVDKVLTQKYFNDEIWP